MPKKDQPKPRANPSDKQFACGFLRFNGRSVAIPGQPKKSEPEDRSPHAFFEWIATGLLVPCLPFDPSGGYRVPDGGRFFSIEQAAERYGLSEEFLILAYKRYLDEVGFVSLAKTFREVMFDDEGRPQWGRGGEPVCARKRKEARHAK